MDPFEEERQARFVRPIDAIQQILVRILGELAQAKDSQVAAETQRLYDGALDLLFHCLNLANPLAFRREENGYLAFTWSDHTPAPKAFRWVVSSPDGRSRQGAEETQRACEEAVEQRLRKGF